MDNGPKLTKYNPSDSAGQDNKAYELEAPRYDAKNGHPAAVSDTEIKLQDLNHDSELRQRRPNLSHSDELYVDDLVPRPREFNPEDQNAFIRGIMWTQKSVEGAYKDNKRSVWIFIGVVLLILYIVYFGFALAHEFGSEASWRLLISTAFGLFLLALYLFGSCLDPLKEKLDDFLTNPGKAKTRKVIRWTLYILSSILTVTLLIVVVALDEPENLLSLAGLAAFIVLGFLTSYSPAMIDWHPVFWGFSIQFYFAVIILKTTWGYEAFKWLGDRITEFLAYSDAGAKFVFSDYAKITPLDPSQQPIEFLGAFSLHFFAFELMPVVTFFSTFIGVLYYLGVMQAIVKVIGRFLSFCLGTTPAESLNAAGNIFVAMTESPLMIRPFIPTMTRSELHAVMTGGFATIAGSVLGAYIGFGVPADHLLSASVMSAPAALAISKLTYPEIDVPIIKDEDYDKIENTKETNVIEAACNGAIISAKIIASIIVNVIAFLSLLEFVNATLVWFGERVGKEDFTFQYICSYVLYPIALFMGTKPKDCRRVAELVGVKTFTNEFIAYEQLSVLLKNREKFEAYNFTDWFKDGDDIILPGTNETLVKGILSERSEIIATYALCGFSNFGSMGILLGGLSAMAPQRRPVMSKLIFRAMIAGNIACFFTACIAGLFFEPRN